MIDSDEVGRDKSVRRGGGASLDLPKVRRNPLVEIIAINTGCLNQVQNGFYPSLHFHFSLVYFFKTKQFNVR